MIDWENLDSLNMEIDSLLYYISDIDEIAEKKWFIKINEDDLGMNIVNPNGLYKLLYKHIKKEDPDNTIIDIITIKKWAYLFSISENFMYNFSLLDKENSVYIDKKFDQDFIKLTQEYYFLELFKEIRYDNKYDLIDRTTFAIVYEIYTYFEDKLHGMLFDTWYFWTTSKYINKLLQEKNEKELLEFDDFVLWIDLSQQSRLKTKIHKIYLKYIHETNVNDWNNKKVIKKSISTK